MQNIILKNQNQLYNSLPNPQLGSKYSKLAQRFSNKSNLTSNKILTKKNLSLSQYSSLNIQNQSKQQIKKNSQKQHSSLQQTQLEYFKQINNQIKLENLNLKQDLKICQEKLKKLTQDKMKSQQKLVSYHKAVTKSQKKISSLMQFAQQLIVMVKDRYLDQQKVSSVNLGSLKNSSSVKYFLEPLQIKGVEIKKQIYRIKDQTDENRRRPSAIKKKTIDAMIQEHKAQLQKQTKNLKKAKKSTFYQLSSQNKSTNSLNQNIKEQQQLINDLKNCQFQSKEQIQLQNSLKSFEHDVKEIKVLKKLMEDIVRTFNEETQTDSTLFKINDNGSVNNQSEIINFVLQHIGTFFNNLIEEHSSHSTLSLSIDSLVVNEKIKPSYTSQRLYKSIKEIFDHQICLLESQKMHFLQCKNKRLLKFIYQCSGCEKYQEMFAQIFRILRQGFKEIKWKILPQLKNKNEDQLQILL